MYDEDGACGSPLDVSTNLRLKEETKVMNAWSPGTADSIQSKSKLPVICHIGGEWWTSGYF